MVYRFIIEFQCIKFFAELRLNFQVTIYRRQAGKYGMKIFQSKYYRKDADDQLWLIIGFRVIFPVSFVKNYSGHDYFEIFNALHAQQNAISSMVWTEKS